MEVKEKLKQIADLAMKAITPDKNIINLAQIARVEKWYIEVENDAFAVGNKVIRKWWDNETEPLQAGEYELENGEKMMVDSSGIITSIDNEVQLKSNKVDIKEQEELQAKLDLAVTEKEAIQKELEALKMEAEKKENEAKKEIELSEAEKTQKQITEMSEAIAKMQETITELAKQPVIAEEKVDLSKLTFAEKQILEDEKNNK